MQAGKSRGVWGDALPGNFYKLDALRLLLGPFLDKSRAVVSSSLVSSPCAPPGEKRSGERSEIPWAYSPKRWKTNEIARSLIIT